MGSISRYIFRTTFGAFLTITICLTGLIWLTQALRDIDLVTNQGQSVLSFVSITVMIMPSLVLLIAPVALFIAMTHTLNKLSADSEIIVMSAAGMTPWQVFRAYIAVATVVSLLMIALTTYLSAKSLRTLRDRIVEVRANLVSNIVKPGRFVTVEGGVTFHIRARSPSGELLGVLMDDRRNAAERSTIIADSGSVLDNESGTFLVLRTGTIQRYEATNREPSTVVFDRYAIDLSRFSGGPVKIRYSLRERYLWQLLFPDPADPLLNEQPGLFRAELFDRIMQPFYPFAFAIIAFAYLGSPRTTRQNRTLSIIGAVSAMALLRMIGFVSTVFGANVPVLLAVQYVAVAGTIGVGLVVIARGVVIEPPTFIVDGAAKLAERLSRRYATS
ncbi:MAG: LPS export ABC transporter permease LptF [Pseudolabrys sp.]